MTSATAGATTAGAVAASVGATCEGDPDRPLTGVASLETAGPQDLSFFAGGRWEHALAATRAGAVLLDVGDVPPGVVALRHANPRWAFARAAAALCPTDWPAPGVHPRAEVHETARVDGATIEAFAVIGAGAVVEPGAWVQSFVYVGAGAHVGGGSRLMPHAVVLERCRLGRGVRLQPGAVVGADGFGYARGPGGLEKFPQLGAVVVADDVEIGANSCVDRGALGDTYVGRGTRTDNLVQIAHNVRIGAECLLAAFAGVAGGARLGDRVMLGGRAAVVDGVSIGDDAVLFALASASHDAPKGAKLGGSPARTYRQWTRELAAVRALPERLRAFDRLEKRVRALLGADEEEGR